MNSCIDHFFSYTGEWKQNTKLAVLFQPKIGLYFWLQVKLKALKLKLIPLTTNTISAKDKFVSKIFTWSLLHNSLLYYFCWQHFLLLASKKWSPKEVKIPCLRRKKILLLSVKTLTIVMLKKQKRGNLDFLY